MKHASKHNLLIWALTDNKPGHRNQLEGLIAALLAIRQITVKWIVVTEHVKGIMELVTGKSSKSVEEKPDVILAAGHRTHLQLLAYKKHLHRPIVVMMKPSLPLSWFDVCLIPRHDNPPHRANVIETLGAINRVTPSVNRLENSGLIMLGGPSKHYNWRDSCVINDMKELFKQTAHMQWQVGSSRRTPDSLLAQIESLFPDMPIITPDSVSKDWLPQQMQQADAIWVTEDSVSMVYEAMTSGAKTGIIKLDKNKENRITKEMQRLVEEGRVASLKHPVEQAVQPLNEAQRCAEILLSKLGL